MTYSRRAVVNTSGVSTPAWLMPRLQSEHVDMGKSDLPVLLSMRECAFESVTASRLQRRELATETNGAIARARAATHLARCDSENVRETSYNSSSESSCWRLGLRHVHATIAWRPHAQGVCRMLVQTGWSWGQPGAAAAASKDESVTLSGQVSGLGFDGRSRGPFMSESHKAAYATTSEVTSLESSYARLFEMMQQSQPQTPRKTTAMCRKQLTCVPCAGRYSRAAACTCSGESRAVAHDGTPGDLAGHSSAGG